MLTSFFAHDVAIGLRARPRRALRIKGGGTVYQVGCLVGKAVYYD